MTKYLTRNKINGLLDPRFKHCWNVWGWLVAEVYECGNIMNRRQLKQILESKIKVISSKYKITIKSMFHNYFDNVFFNRPDLCGAECSCWGRKNPPTDWYHPPVLRLPTPLSSNPFPLRSGLLLSPNPHADNGDTNRTTKKRLAIRLSTYRWK